MSIGFKEWALVCEELGQGRQSIILRKGGIAEGRAGFRFQHEGFFLFPTFFHEQIGRTRLPAERDLTPPRSDRVEIRYAARVEWTEVITDLSVAECLAPFHIWAPSVIEERFNYDKVGELNLAFVRVFRLEPLWTFPNEPRYGGCRSWVDLPDFPSSIARVPSLDDAGHQARTVAIRTALSGRRSAAA